MRSSSSVNFFANTGVGEMIVRAWAGCGGYSRFLTRSARHGEFVKVRLLANVVADSLKHANVGFADSDLNKVRAISAHKGNYGLDTSHPDIVEDDVAADCAERGIRILGSSVCALQRSVTSRANESARSL
jgi:hypothetical protein